MPSKNANREKAVLRDRLQTMVENPDVARHPALLAELTRECPNTICIKKSPHWIRCYTCLVHVLEFTEKPEYVEIERDEIDDINAGPVFAHWLIAGRFLVELSQAEAGDTDFVFYFNEGAWKHAGLWSRSGRVLSKWGIGLLYEHELNEVPMGFGNDVKFYKRLQYNYAFVLFRRYVKEKGHPLESGDP